MPAPSNEPHKVDASAPPLPGKAPPPFIPPQNDSLEMKPGEELEIVDFNDMAKFTGSNSVSNLSTESREVPGSARRPVASDFFGEDQSKEEHVTWRKPAPGTLDMQQEHSYPVSLPQNAMTPTKASTDGFRPSAIDIPSRALDTSIGSNFTSPRLPKSPMPQTYREAPLSALDDTMSRIKGALDTMHSGKSGERDSPSKSQAEHVQSVLPPGTKMVTIGKWLPPAKRAPGPLPSYSRSPLFAVSSPEPPRSPPPPLNRLVIRMPKKVNRVAWTPSKKHSQMLKTTTCYVRWDILSFDPPVEGMTKKSLSVNDILFKRPPGSFKRSFQHTVVLPKSTGIQRVPFTPITQLSAPVPPIRVNLSSGSTGRSFSKGMSDEGSWRNSKTNTSSDAAAANVSVELNVTSRSPPPDPGLLKEDSQEQPSETRQSASSFAKLKAPQGMPDGADLAFYRGPQGGLQSLANTRKVSFTVTSELDDVLFGPDVDEKVDPPVAVAITKPLDGTRIDLRSNGVQSMSAALAPVLSLTEADDQESEDKIQSRILEHTVRHFYMQIIIVMLIVG